MEHHVQRQRAWSASAMLANSSPNPPLTQHVCKEFSVGIVGLAGYIIGR